MNILGHVDDFGTPLQYSCLENPMDGEACGAAVHGVAKSRTRLSDFTFTFHFHALEKEMATHSCSCLENPRDAGAWWAAVYGVTQSRTWLKWLSSSSSTDSLPCKIILLYSFSIVLPVPHKLHENNGLLMPFLPEPRTPINTIWCMAP